MKKIIGLTGVIGSGKTTVADMLGKLGAVIIDADAVARKIVEPGEPAYKDIVSKFGAEILHANKTIDRHKLAKIVFNDKDKLKALEAITHPRIISRIRDVHQKVEEGIVVIEAPLLLETGLESMMDEVWVVYSGKQQQIQRLKAFRGLQEEDIKKRMYYQIPEQEKLKRADRIIDNSGSREDTWYQVKKIWESLNIV